MIYLKLYEAFNQVEKIQKLNKIVLDYFVASYFDMNTEFVELSDHYFLFLNIKANSKISALDVDIRNTKMYLYVDENFLNKRLKGYLTKSLGKQLTNSIGAFDGPYIDSIKSYCIKKFNFQHKVIVFTQ